MSTWNYNKIEFGKSVSSNEGSFVRLPQISHFKSFAHALEQAIRRHKRVAAAKILRRYSEDRCRAVKRRYLGFIALQSEYAGILWIAAAPLKDVVCRKSSTSYKKIFSFWKSKNAAILPYYKWWDKQKRENILFQESLYSGCFVYAPNEIQTDCGSEFTHIAKTKRVHALDRFCAQYNIRHHVLRPRTPWHNGKVERSHRNDQERFYNHLSFYSFDDLQMQMNRYLKRADNIPMAVLGWKSPNQKHRELGGNWLTLVFFRIVTALSTVGMNGKPLLTKVSQSELT